MRKGFFYIIPCVFLLSCQPTSLEDFRSEGEGRARALLKNLRKIDCREDLVKVEPLLKRDFESLVDLMIQAKTFQGKNPEAEIFFQNINQVLNASLIEEMKRVYSIEGGGELVEKVQKEAMLRLDAKEKMIEKQQSSLNRK